METTNEVKQKMTYESRIALVAQNFSAKMSTLFQPHVRLRDNDSGGIYLQEIAEAINSRLPAEIPNNDVYISALREIWQGVTAKHKSNYWFSLADVISATNKVSSKYQAIYGKTKAKAFGGTFEAEQQAREAEQKKPETVEGWLAKLEETDRMIASGELKGGIGQILRKIPCSALARLGYEGDTSFKGIGETPKEHLPDDSGEINMDLIKAGHTAPKFDPFDLAAPLEDPLPDNLKPTVPSLDSL